MNTGREGNRQHCYTGRGQPDDHYEDKEPSLGSDSEEAGRENCHLDEHCPLITQTRHTCRLGNVHSIG